MARVLKAAGIQVQVWSEDRLPTASERARAVRRRAERRPPGAPAAEPRPSGRQADAA